MKTRLPVSGGDAGTWGNILNIFLEVSHNNDGTLQTSAVQQAGGVTSVNTVTPNNGNVTLTAGNIGALSATASAGGDLSGSYPNPTVAKVNGLTLPNTAPSANQVLTATSDTASSWQTVAGTTGWINVVTAYDADPSGANDSTTAIQNAVTSAISAKGGVVYLPAGKYKVSSTITANSIYPINIVGDGCYVTTIKFTGTGDCLRIYDSIIPSGTVDFIGGSLEGLTIDGTNAGDGSTGLHIGDGEGYQIDCAISNFSGTGSIGVHFDNANWWTEKLSVRMYLENCTQHAVFDVTGATTSSNSFGYSDLLFYIEANPGQDGVVFQNGAYLYHGSLKIRGNFETSATSVSNAVLRITGTVPTGHPAAGSGAGFYADILDIQVEADTSLSSNYPCQTIYLGAAYTNAIYGCVGIMDFTGPIAFVASNLSAQGQANSMSFSGYVNGDANLNPSGQGGFIHIGVPQTYWQAYFDGSGGSLYCSAADFFQATLSANITVNLTPSDSNIAAPQRKTIVITQATSGGPYTVTWPHTPTPTTSSPTVVWAGGTAPTMSIGAGAVDVYKLETIDGATWYAQAVQNVS